MWASGNLKIYTLGVKSLAFCHWWRQMKCPCTVGFSCECSSTFELGSAFYLARLMTLPGIGLEVLRRFSEGETGPDCYGFVNPVTGVNSLLK